MSTKDQYIEKFQAEINTLNVEIGNLNSKITSSMIDAGTKLAHEEQMSALRQQRDDASTWLAEIQASDGDTWDYLKNRLEGIDGNAIRP